MLEPENAWTCPQDSLTKCPSHPIDEMLMPLCRLEWALLMPSSPFAAEVGNQTTLGWCATPGQTILTFSEILFSIIKKSLRSKFAAPQMLRNDKIVQVWKNMKNAWCWLNCCSTCGAKCSNIEPRIIFHHKTTKFQQKNRDELFGASFPKATGAKHRNLWSYI